MAWNPITDPVDYVLFAGRRTPGIAEVSGGSSPRKWEERKGYALSGARVVFRGLGLAKPVVSIRLYTRADWDEWESFKIIVQRPPSMTRPRAIDVWHPLLEEIDVRSVVVEDVSQPEQRADGEWVVTIKLIEHRAPTFALASPDGSQAQETDPYEQRIAANSARIAALNEELAGL
jgi:hypothetical protein